MYRQVLDGFDYSSGPTGEAAAVLAHSQKIRTAKTAAICDEWHEQVFDKIQDRIQSELETRGSAGISKRLQRNMQDYLHTTNTKIAVFRDVIIEKDYNPLLAQQDFIRVATGDLADPLAKDLERRQHEASLLTGRRSTSMPHAASKSALDIKMWDDLHIHSTPYGHCVDKDGNYIVRPQSVGAQRLRKSTIPLDHYNVPTGKEVVDAEAPPGKRSVPGPEVRRGRKNLFDVLQQTGGANPEFTGGDQWMEQKGKATVPGPERVRGRPDLFETIQQRPGVGMVGDIWLEQKGKRFVPGPEVRRGRKDLTETLRQNSAPARPADIVGDMWLEQKGRGLPPRRPDHNMQDIVTDRVVAPTIIRPATRPPHRNQLSSITTLDGCIVAAEPVKSH